MNAAKEKVGNSIDIKKPLLQWFLSLFLGQSLELVHENIGDFFVVQFTFDAPSKLSQISALDIKQC